MGFIVLLIIVYLIFADHKQKTEQAPFSVRFKTFCKNVTLGVVGFFALIFIMGLVL